MRFSRSLITQDGSMRAKIIVLLAGACVFAIAVGAFAFKRKVRPPVVAPPEIVAISKSSPAYCSDGINHYCLVGQAEAGSITLPSATPYWQSKLIWDEDGVPVFAGPNGERFRNQATIAFSWLSRINISFDEACRNYSLSPAAEAAKAYLLKTAIPLEGGAAVTWLYDYETQINDVLLKPPFASAFSQAAIAERLLLHHCKTGDTEALSLAKRVGKVFAIPVDRGGVRSQSDDFVWFQEVPISDRHNPFIVNAHLYAIQTLHLLDDKFPDEGFGDLAGRGLSSLRAAMDVIDTGYWNRYDLRPRYSPITVRLTGSAIISKATLKGPVESSINLLSAGPQAVRGNGYSEVELQRQTKNGVVLTDKPLDLWFATEIGREFFPALINQPLVLDLEVSAGTNVNAAAISATSGELRFVDLARVASNGDPATASFSMGLSDLTWGQVAPEYIPFGAHLLANIARKVDDESLFLRAVRWEQFSRRFAEIEAKQVVLRKWQWNDDREFAKAFYARFGQLLPDRISEDDLKAFVDDLDMDAPRRQAAMETLALARMP